jgi:hypothetical protein
MAESPNPNEQSWVCHRCNTHQTIDRESGTFVLHAIIDTGVYPAGRTKCPGSGEKPLTSRHGAGSNFESCPAATGERFMPDQGCTQFPDGAHRCGKARSHMPDSWAAGDIRAASHQCTCDYVWFNQPGTLDAFMAEMSRIFAARPPAANCTHVWIMRQGIYYCETCGERE